MNKKKVKILVTGASGQLGRNLVQNLVLRGYNVRAHYRTPDKAREYCPTGVETVYGDLIDGNWVAEAVDGCDIVIHCAAWVSLRNVDYHKMYSVNVEGTQKLLKVAQKKGVRRFIHISSIATIGGSVNGYSIDENAPYNFDHLKIPYFETKRLAEKTALKANSDKFEVIVLNPSIMISPVKKYAVAKFINNMPRFIPFYFDFGINIVRTVDVVNGIIESINKGRPGHRYILAGENIDSVKVLSLLYRYLDIGRPKIKIPYFLIYFLGLLFDVFGFLRRMISRGFPAPKFGHRLAQLAKFHLYYSSKKAETELDFKAQSVEDTLRKVISSLTVPTCRKVNYTKREL
jgi:dihydroflavonol-4-reductase